MDTLLVTGAAGFIGSHVVKHYLEKGWHVVGVDNFNDYYSVALKEARHKQFENSPNYKALRCDVSKYEELSEIFKKNNISHVCHLAAQAGVRYSLENPFVYEQSNLKGFLSILECCRHYDVNRLVYASSSSVFGGNTKVPFAEEDRVDQPISLYAATKKANELMAHSYSHLYNLQTIGLRFFTVYGPWGRPDMAAWLFTKAILSGQPIKVFNNGDMQRDFTFIDDIIAGVVSSIDSDSLPKYDLINLGNHKSEKLLHLIEVIEDACGKKAEKIMLPMQPGDVRATYADIDKAQKLLGFEPTTRIEVGIPKFVAWFLAHQDLAMQA